MPSEGPGFSDLIDEIEESEGSEVIRELESLEDTIQILDQNYREVVEIGDWFKAQGLRIQPMRNRGQLEEFQKEYLRLLHNYISAVYSLINHTRRINRNYCSDEFEDRYTAQMEAIGLIRRGEFLRQLRHYTQKRKLPPIDIELLEEDEGIRFTITVKKGEMLDWDEWNVNAREYLEGLDDSIDIHSEILSYHELVDDFYSWYYETVQEHLDDVLDERQELITKLRSRRAELFDGL